MKVKTRVKLVIPKDRMKEAIPLLTELRKRITDQPGYLLAEILRKRDQPNAFLFLTTWQSTQDWERWSGSESRNAIVEKMHFFEESSIEIWDYGFIE